METNGRLTGNRSTISISSSGRLKSKKEKLMIASDKQNARSTSKETKHAKNNKAWKSISDKSNFATSSSTIARTYIHSRRNRDNKSIRKSTSKSN
jgi:hypothetical protein